MKIEENVKVVDNMDKFLIIDGNSIANRAFYGLSVNMTSTYAGIHTNAIYGFLNIYWMILDKFKPEYIAVSFDLSKPTFRHDMYSEYKGTRKGMPDELREQMPVLKDVLRAMNIPILELEGYEADDILGTVSNINTKNNIFTYILTGDKDSLQLISNTTSVIMPSSKASKTEYTVYTPEVLKEKQGIEPYQVIHIKSLMGDSSDNIPGVKGIGEKTAYSLIGKYTTLDNIFENIDNLDASVKIKEKLINDKKMAFLSKELATIKVNAPITFDMEKCKSCEPNLDELYSLFKKLEFNKFMNKYDFSNVDINVDCKGDSNKEASNVDLSTKNIYIIDSTNITEKYEEIINLFNNDKLSYLLNLNKNNFTTNIYLDNKNILALYNEDSVYILNIDSITSFNEKLYKDIIFNFVTSNILKLGYNIKQDLLYFFNNGYYNLVGFNYDIMIAYYLFDSVKSNYLIDYIIYELYSAQIDKSNPETENIEKQISFFDEESINNKEFLNEVQVKNICMYLKGIYLSFDIVNKKLEELDMLNLFNNVEMPLVETLASMEHTGMHINVDKLNEFDKEISNSLGVLEQEIFNIAGEVFNINSTQQLGIILFEKLGLPTKKKTKTGYSTDKNVLEELEEYHEIIPKILEYRQLAKLKSTYVDGLRDKISDDERIHTTFMQTVASTGRLSSVEPNLQNIPIRLELGSKIRTFFDAENENVIIDADYSQIELRVLAHFSEDKAMCDAFNNDIDVHKVTASQVFNIPLDEVTSTMRSHAKAVNFGIVYGISEYGLSKNINISISEAKKYIESYLNTYNGISTFMEKIVDIAKEKGYVSTMFGRRRYIPELKSKNKNIIQFGKRVAMNTPIQGTAADIIKLAMNDIYKKLKEKGLKSKLIMQVHDELLIETLPEEIETVKEIMINSMENVVKLKVPLNIDINVGKTWYDAK